MYEPFKCLFSLCMSRMPTVHISYYYTGVLHATFPKGGWVLFYRRGGTEILLINFVDLGYRLLMQLV